MVKVIATGASSAYNKAIKEFHRVVVKGEIFEVTEERFKVLNGDNKYGLKFVELYNGSQPAPQPTTNSVANQPEEVTEDPEIFIINPGEDPVQVDKDLQPIKKTTTKKKKVETPKED